MTEDHVDDAKLRGLLDKYGRCTDVCATRHNLKCNCGFQVSMFFIHRQGLRGKMSTVPDLKETEKDVV